MYDAARTVSIKPREERKLERLARAMPDPAELSDKVAGTVEETADLFSSEYKPSSEWGEDPRA